MRQFLLVLFLLIAFRDSMFAQQARQYAFKHFSTLNGLVSNSVHSIAQDKQGYIWMATSNGLQRYDGNAFLTFTANENRPKSIPSNNIYHIFIDSRNNLWLLGENNSIGIFDTKKFEFSKVKLQKGFVPGNQPRFVEYISGELMLIDNNGDIFLYVEKENAFKQANNILPRPPEWKLSHVIWDDFNKKFWMSANKGLLLYDPATKNMSYSGHNISNDPIITAFKDAVGLTEIIFDKKGNLLAVKQQRSSDTPELLYYEKGSSTIQVLSLTDQLGVRHFHTDGFTLQKNGRIWLYGMPFLAEWSQTERKFIPVVKGDKGQQSGYFNRVYQTYEDRENNIWVASDNGVLLFHPDIQAFSSYDLIRPGSAVSRELVQAVAEAKDGSIFVGTWRGGLFAYDKHLNPMALPPVYKTKGLTMSVADMDNHKPTGTIWLTQEQGKIDVYHPEKNTVIEINDTIFKGSTIRQITSDTSGNIWLGTQGGRLIKWDYKKSNGDPRKGYEVVFQTSIIRKVHFDYQGYIWVATANNGLYKINSKTLKVVQHFSIDSPNGTRLFTNNVKDITYYNDSTLLVAAGCLNIINKKTNTVQFFSTKEGLPSNTLESVQKDKNGNVWMGMTNGLARLNYEKKIISYYDRRDGITYDKFMQTGVQQLSGNRLFFFTDHNFMAFDPDQVSPKQLPPRPYITSFRLGNLPLSIDSLQREKQVVLRYTDNSFSIDFSAMSFLQQQKLHYYYKLEGLNNEWIHTDRPTAISYNYLPPNTYTFLVRTENIDGLSNNAMARLTIVINAPFWKTWWFYSLLLLAFITIWYLVDRERVNKRKMLLQVRSEIANNLHDDISTNLNDINILSEMAKIKAGKNVEQSKDFIAQISDKSSSMILAMDDMLWSINPANDSMKNTINRIKELTNGLMSGNDIDIELMLDNKLEEQELDMKLRHDIYFLYKEAVTFFAKNGQFRQIFVNLKYKKQTLMIEILSERPEQNQLDFESQLNRTLKKRAEHLSVEYHFSMEAKHSLLVLTIPLKQT